MESVISRLDTNYRGSTVGQETGSHLRTLSYETTTDLFLITIINKSNYRSSIKRSAQECLTEALRNKCSRVLKKST